MSADNWAICPKCNNRIEEINQKLNNEYGTVPKEEYDKLQKELAVKEKEKYTFREDWEIGVYKGEFEVSYFGNCTVCNFELNFNHTEQIA